MYDHYVWQVYAFLSYRVRDAQAAEDLTQSTFERALKAWPRYDPGKGAVTTWLMAIARNVAIDHHRRSPMVEPLLDEHIGAEASPEERLAVRAELADALAQLNEREREVIALRFAGDLATAEIGEILEMSPNNVQQILSRALRRLRTVLPASGAEYAEDTRSS